MFDYINGKLDNVQLTVRGVFATVEVGGIGYRTEITEADAAKMPSVGEVVKLYTVLLHKEDSMTLCGFLKKEARDIFRILISVSGVGGKMAMTLLNEFEPNEIITLVVAGDFKELTRAKGVGPKLAQKIILELKDKFLNLHVPANSDVKQSYKNSQSIDEVKIALTSLGYEKDEINDAISVSINNVKNETPEELLREALKYLSK